MKARIVRFALLTSIGGLLSAFGSSQETVPPATLYSVCEVLQNLKALDHTTISVRGVLVGGEHGSFLSGACGRHITTKGFTWPDVIWLTNPRDSKGMFTADKKAHEQVRNEIRQLRLRPKDKLVLTYVGTLETRDLGESVVVNRAGDLVGFGYGPDSDAPAQLIVKTVKDPEVLRQKH
jgi:hypothetical protein